MHRATLFSCTPLRQLLLRTATVVVLSGAATANATNDGLTITSPTQWVRAIAGRPYAFTPKVVNPSGRPLTFRILNRPSWATLNAKTGQLSGTTPNILKNYSNISISVTDGVATVKTGYFIIRVLPPSTYDKPIISGTPSTSVTTGSPYAFQPSASDAFGQPLSFSVKNK
ncbi:MAG TPA: putative Ig domain-containing protein, partial [Steroidobacteraceae bacterium]